MQNENGIRPWRHIERRKTRQIKVGNVLVGGSQNSIALQPVSVQGQAGVNIAAGLAAFTLEYVPGKGTVFLINGVQKGETVTEPGFMEAVLRIWVGPKPVDSQLKELLLGAPPKKTRYPTTSSMGAHISRCINPWPPCPLRIGAFGGVCGADE